MIKNCNLIDMAGTFQQPRDLLVEGSKVKEVGEHIPEQKGWEVIDAAGRLVTPGIIDPHSHLGVSGTGKREGNDTNEMTSPVTPGICLIISGVMLSFPSPYQRNVICISISSLPSS